MCFKSTYKMYQTSKILNEGHSFITVPIFSQILILNSQFRN